MAETTQIPAWIALFLGLYSLAAAVGEFRSPGSWVTMLKDFERSPALRYLTGMFCVVLGAAIYLVTPWNPADWLAVAVSAIGGLCAAEGLLILAAGDRFLRLARGLMGRANAFWAGFAALFGVAAIAVALLRL
ncbi:hypothetical protein [Tsuneonella sp. HG222]